MHCQLFTGMNVEHTWFHHSDQFLDHLLLIGLPNEQNPFGFITMYAKECCQLRFMVLKNCSAFGQIIEIQQYIDGRGHPIKHGGARWLHCIWLRVLTS